MGRSWGICIGCNDMMPDDFIDQRGLCDLCSGADMPNLASDLSDVATDFGNAFIDRAKDTGKEAAAVLKWAAKEAQTASAKWMSHNVTDDQFKRWLNKLATVRVPAKLGAIANRKARAELEFIIGTAFKALGILAGAL